MKYKQRPKRDPVKNYFQLVLDQFCDQQMAQMDVAAERQRVAKALTLRSDKCGSA